MRDIPRVCTSRTSRIVERSTNTANQGDDSRNRKKKSIQPALRHPHTSDLFSSARNMARFSCVAATRSLTTAARPPPPILHDTITPPSRDPVPRHPLPNRMLPPTHPLPNNMPSPAYVTCPPIPLAPNVEFSSPSAPTARGHAAAARLSSTAKTRLVKLLPQHLA